MRKITWFQVKQFYWDTIDLFEDPIYSSYIERDIFVEIYNKLLNELDGGDEFHYFTSYFERSPINNGIILFKNNEVKEDFYDFALELGLVMSIDEIHEGESIKEKQQRTKERKITCPKVAQQKRSEQMLKTLDKLKQSLELETDQCIIRKINDKMQRILQQIDKTV